MPPPLSTHLAKRPRPEDGAASAATASSDDDGLQRVYVANADANAIEEVEGAADAAAAVASVADLPPQPHSVPIYEVGQAVRLLHV